MTTVIDATGSQALDNWWRLLGSLDDVQVTQFVWDNRLLAVAGLVGGRWWLAEGSVMVVQRPDVLATTEYVIEPRADDARDHPWAVFQHAGVSYICRFTGNATWAAIKTACRYARAPVLAACKMEGTLHARVAADVVTAAILALHEYPPP